jgi:methionine synthase II (cobalamin-independent)
MIMPSDTPFRAHGLPLLIGSLPIHDANIAIKEWILTATPGIPIWPQLPANPCEQMLHQFAEGLPGVVEESFGNSDSRIFYDTEASGFEEAQLAFYEEYLQVMEDPHLLLGSRFAVSRGRAQGIYTLADMAATLLDPVALKGQITGPFTMLTGIHDREDRLGYYNGTIRDIVVKGLAMKAAWQALFLGQNSNLPVLIFIDEPALAGLGSSAFISIAAGDIQADINEVAAALHSVGALAGVHVCANTEWDILLGSDIDILSFDAHGYFDRLILLKEQLHAYLDQGKILAWGIVPTSDHEAIERESCASLVALWEEQAAELVRPGRDLAAILRQTLITPSCGTGSLPPELARKVLDLTRDISRELKEKYQV